MVSCYPPVPLSHSSRSQISSVIVSLSLRAFIEYRKGISFTQSTQTIHKIGIEGSTILNYRYPADGVCHDRVYQASIRRNHTSQYPVRSRTPLTSTLVDPLLCVQLFFLIIISVSTGFQQLVRVLIIFKILSFARFALFSVIERS